MADESIIPTPENDVGPNTQIEQIAVELTALIANVVRSYKEGKNFTSADQERVEVKFAALATKALLADKIANNTEGVTANSSNSSFTYTQLITEVKKEIQKVTIDSKDSEYYANKLDNLITNRLGSLKTEILGGADDAWDTLKELKDRLEGYKLDDKDVVGVISKAVSEGIASANTFATSADTTVTNSLTALIDGEIELRKSAISGINQSIESIENTQEGHTSALSTHTENIETNKDAIAAEVETRTALSASFENETKKGGNRDEAITSAVNAAIKAITGTSEQFTKSKERIVKFNPFK